MPGHQNTCNPLRRLPKQCLSFIEQLIYTVWFRHYDFHVLTCQTKHCDQPFPESDGSKRWRPAGFACGTPPFGQDG